MIQKIPDPEGKRSRKAVQDEAARPETRLAGEAAHSPDALPEPAVPPVDNDESDPNEEGLESASDRNLPLAEALEPDPGEAAAQGSEQAAELAAARADAPDAELLDGAPALGADGAAEVAPVVSGEDVAGESGSEADDEGGLGDQTQAGAKPKRKAKRKARTEAGDPAQDEDSPQAEQASEGGAEQASEEGAEQPADEDPSSEPVCDRPLDMRLEAVIFASGQALSVQRLSRVLSVPGDELKPALEALAQRWADAGAAIELVEIGGGWRFMTRPDFQPDVAGLAKKARAERLSPAALETLAVVAYRQPIGRADIEAVRGVAAGPLLRVLLDRDLIRITGRSPEPGHPLLYGTTRRFLDHFGLRSLKSLPDIKDLLDVS